MSTAPRPYSRAVAAVFLVAGVSLSSAISRLPEIKAQVGATPTEMAFALVCTGIGSIIGMPFAGRLCARFGTAPITAIFFTITLAGLPLLPLARSVPQLAAILLCIGFGVGSSDVAINVQGSIVERHLRRVLMPLWHGLFSTGAVLGALAGAGAARWGLPLAWQLPILSAPLWLVVIGSCRVFLPNPAPDIYDAPSGDGPRALPAPGSAPGLAEGRRQGRITAAEILIGLVMLASSLGEGAANDWLAIALVDERGAPAAIGALTLAGFNLTMAIGRFTGGPLIARFGRVTVLRAAGVMAAAGILTLCLVPSTALAFAGAAAWGLGLAVVFPSGISAAGEIPGRGSQAIATVSTIGYGGFLLGAPLIGTLAHAIPLMDALLVVAGAAIAIAVVAPALRERHTPAPAPEPR